MGHAGAITIDRSTGVLRAVRIRAGDGAAVDFSQWPVRCR